MREQPAWTFRNVPAYQEDDCCKDGAQEKAHAPSKLGAQYARVKQYQTQRSAQRRAQPKTAVNREIDTPTQPRRDELVYCEVDGGVFTPDTEARGKAANRKPSIIRRKRSCELSL